jgi:PAS domain S-box-containing protein
LEGTLSLAEAILEQIADAVIFADTTGTIRRWNRAAAALFGYSAAQALGKKLDLIIPEHLRAAHWRGFEGAIAAPKRPPIVQRFRKLHIRQVVPHRKQHRPEQRNRPPPRLALRRAGNTCQSSTNRSPIDYAAQIIQRATTASLRTSKCKAFLTDPTTLDSIP